MDGSMRLRVLRIQADVIGGWLTSGVPFAAAPESPTQDVTVLGATYIPMTNEVRLLVSSDSFDEFTGAHAWDAPEWMPMFTRKVGV